MKNAGEEAEVETDCINGVVGFIIKYSCFNFFSQEKSFSTFRLISILLIICTFPLSLFVTVKMVQVVQTPNINKLSCLNFLNPPRW